MSDFKTREPSINLMRRRRASDPNFMSNKVESLLTENSYTNIQFVPVERLISFKNQRRSYFDQAKLKALADTIKEHGIRQPLTVIQSDEDLTKFEIVSGERRFLAAKMVGIDKVPCILIHNRQAAEEIAIIENVQRADLHPIELGRAYIGILEQGVVTSQGDLASKIGVPRSQISEYMTFAKLPDNIADELISNNVTIRGVLRKLAKCDNTEAMEKIVAVALGRKPAVRRKTLLKMALSDQGVVEAEIYDNVSFDKETLCSLRDSLQLVIENINKKIDKL